MPLIDSHAHLDMYPADELPGVLARAYAAGVRTILAIGIGDGPHQMHRALEIAEATSSPDLPAIYASAGIHPQEAAAATPEALAQLAALAANPRSIAIGEIGLDYYHVENPTPAIMPCSSGGVDEPRRSLSLGFHLSFAGNLTYPAAKSIREAAAFAPPDRILVETDAPFLAPIPFHRQRNEPARR